MSTQDSLDQASEGVERINKRVNGLEQAVEELKQAIMQRKQADSEQPPTHRMFYFLTLAIIGLQIAVALLVIAPLIPDVLLSTIYVCSGIAVMMGGLLLLMYGLMLRRSIVFPGDKDWGAK